MLIVFTILLIILSYVLFTPLTVRLNIVIGEKISAISVAEFFPFKFRIYPKPSQPEKAEVPKVEKPRKRPGGSKKRKLDYSALDSFDIKMLLGVAGNAFRLLARLLKAPDYYLEARLSGGADQPDITGQLYGAYHAIKPNLPQAIKISYAPDYLAGRISGEISGKLAVTNFQIIKELINFVFRLPVIKLIGLYLKLRKGKGNGK
jgi:hypothetical protein